MDYARSRGRPDPLRVQLVQHIEAEPELVRTLTRTLTRRSLIDHSYCEGIALLYTHNSFTFACPNVLTSFTRTVLPRRLELIKHLKLSVHCHTLLYNLGRYSSSFMESDWQIACASLQRFTGLKTLTINIRIESYHSQRSTRRGWDGFAGSRWLQRILSPLEPLSARDDFLVRYTWPERDCSQWPAGKFRMEHEPGYA